MSDNDLEKEGREDQSVGKLQESIGEAAGNKEMETEGRIRQAEGEMTEGLGQAGDKVEDAAHDAREALRD